MPVQKTFTIIPAPPSRDVSPAIPTAGRPQIMTSKQVKAAHKAANKGPKLSRAEQRQIEKAEQARIRKEFEKEKAAAKARLLRDKKKDKEDAEKAEKKKKGLPTVKIRPSQGMIAGWVRGKKRDSEGSVVETTNNLDVDEKERDNVLVAVMEEDRRSSKAVSPAFEQQTHQLETTSIPNQSPDEPKSRDTGSLPLDDPAGKLPQSEDSSPSRNNSATALGLPKESRHEGLHEPPQDQVTTTIIDQPPADFGIDLDDLDPALLEDWEPANEPITRPQPPDPYAVDLGLSSPRRRGSSQEHNVRSSGGSGGQKNTSRHPHTNESPRQGLGRATGPDEPSLVVKKPIMQMGWKNRSHTLNARSGPCPPALQQPECSVPQFEETIPRASGQAPPLEGPVLTSHDASIVEILSGDFDLDDDLVEELAFAPSAGTRKTAVEIPVSLKSNEGDRGICSQDFWDVDLLETKQPSTQGAQVKEKNHENRRTTCPVQNSSHEGTSSDDFGDLDDDITLSQLPPITPRPYHPATSLRDTATAARQPEPTTPAPCEKRGLMDPPPLPRSAASGNSNGSPAQHLPPPSTQAIMLNPEDFFPTSSQQALELEEDSPQLPQRASLTIQRAVPAPTFKSPAQPAPMKKQKTAIQQAPPPPSSPPPRFFTSSGSRSRHSLKMLQERRAKDREELRKMEERRVEKGRVEAEKRRLERDKRRHEEERWKQNHEQKRRQEEGGQRPLFQLQRVQQPSIIRSGILKNKVRPARPVLSGKENNDPVGKAFDGIELDHGVIMESGVSELASASQESFGGDWVDDLDVDLTIS